MFSIYDLRRRLWPILQGDRGAEDDLMDIWKTGAPDPSPDSAPCQGTVCLRSRLYNQRPCGKLGCAREKRILFPAQFTTWWESIAKRRGIDLTAKEALDGKKAK
jgi:hypothetical protein